MRGGGELRLGCLDAWMLGMRPGSAPAGGEEGGKTDGCNQTTK